MPAPRSNLHGIVDQSKRQQIPVDAPISQHTPLFMLMTKRGPVEPHTLGIDGFDIYYDLYSLQEQSIWHSHQSHFLKQILQSGNSTVVIKRIIDNASKIASVIVGQDPTTNTIRSMELDRVTSPISFSDFVPLIEFEAADPGKWGNYVALEIWVADEKIQNSLGKRLDCKVYEAVVIIEDEETGLRRPLPTLTGQPSTYFVMKPDATDNGINYFFDDIMRENYIEDIEVLTRQANFKSFKLHVDGCAHLTSNPEYYKEDILSSITPVNGEGFKRHMPIFARGGSDGFEPTTNSLLEQRLDRQRRYDEQCRLFLESIDETSPLTDPFKYPFSNIWDSGFTKETKLAMAPLLKLRADIWLNTAVWSDFRYVPTADPNVVEFEPVNTLSDQDTISLAMMYRAYFGAIPESVMWGTPCCRVTLMLPDGVNRQAHGNKYKTLNEWLCVKTAKYLGKGNGIWDSEYAFDNNNQNVVKGWNSIKLDYMAPPLADKVWDAGIMSVSYKNPVDLHFQAFPTLYPDDTSVLNNYFTMMACCQIQKQHQKAWTRVTGNAKFTAQEIADIVDEYMNSSLTGKFDGRFITRSQTFYTKADDLAGYMFTTETEIFCNVTKHTANFKIIAQRL